MGENFPRLLCGRSYRLQFPIATIGVDVWTGLPVSHDSRLDSQASSDPVFDGKDGYFDRYMIVWFLYYRFDISLPYFHFALPYLIRAVALFLAISALA